MSEENDPIITNAMLHAQDAKRIAELEALLAKARDLLIAGQNIVLEDTARIAALERERDALKALLRDVESGIDDYWRTTETGKAVMAKINAALAAKGE